MIENTGEKKPALTIVVQSWATPIVGAVLLVIGLLGGYFGRPLIENGKETTTRTAAPAVAQPTVATSNVTIPEVGSAEELMDYLISQAVHFKGDADAPVTMIEFSDFQ